MNVPAKALIGLGAIGTVGGASYAISTQFTTENISKKLVDDGFKILDESNNEWGAILTNYVKSKTLKFKDFEGKEGEIEKLKQECKKALGSPSSEKDSYDKAKHWCTVPRDLKTLLVKSGYRALSLNVDKDTEDQELWNGKLDKLAKTDPSLEDKKFKGDANIIIKGDALKQEKNRQAIKKKCSELENKKHYEIDFEANLQKSQLWCAIEENNKAGS